MNRALTALFLAPLLIAPLFGLFAFAVAPVMLASTAIAGLPIFLLLRKAKLLAWPYAILAGLVGSVPFIALYLGGAGSYHVEYTGLRNAILLAATGMGAGLAFWWTGIFRNPAFPFVSQASPLSMLVLAPVAVGGLYYWHLLEPQDVEGTVQAVLTRPRADGTESGTARMKLSDGRLVVAQLPLGMAVDGPEGQCYWASERWSGLLNKKLYFLHAPKRKQCE